jgi:hypothetical protein
MQKCTLCHTKHKLIIGGLCPYCRSSVQQKKKNKSETPHKITLTKCTCGICTSNGELGKYAPPPLVTKPCKSCKQPTTSDNGYCQYCWSFGLMGIPPKFVTQVDELTSPALVVKTCAVCGVPVASSPWTQFCKDCKDKVTLTVDLSKDVSHGTMVSIGSKSVHDSVDLYNNEYEPSIDPPLDKPYTNGDPLSMSFKVKVKAPTDPLTGIINPCSEISLDLSTVEQAMKNMPLNPLKMKAASWKAGPNNPIYTDKSVTYTNLEMTEGAAKAKADDIVAKAKAKAQELKQIEYFLSKLKEESYQSKIVDAFITGKPIAPGYLGPTQLEKELAKKEKMAESLKAIKAIAGEPFLLTSPTPFKEDPLLTHFKDYWALSMGTAVEKLKISFEEPQTALSDHSDIEQESVELTLSGLTPEEANQLQKQYGKSKTVMVAKKVRKEVGTNSKAIISWPFESSSMISNGVIPVYKTQLNEDGTVSCNCRGWTTGSAKNPEGRFCKHTKAIESEFDIKALYKKWKKGEPLGEDFELESSSSPSVPGVSKNVGLALVCKRVIEL